VKMNVPGNAFKVYDMSTLANCKFGLEVKALERIRRPACAREGTTRSWHKGHDSPRFRWTLNWFMSSFVSSPHTTAGLLLLLLLLSLSRIDAPWLG